MAKWKKTASRQPVVRGRASKAAPEERAPKKPARMAAPVAAVRPGGEDEGPGLHLVKLCVGATDIADLADWQKKRRRQYKRRYNTHVTRNFPRRADELLDGGSLYWVIAGRVCVRQRLIGIVQRRDKDGAPCCELRLDPKLVETAPWPHRPFQGWRYLEAKDAPPDIASRRGKGDALPPALVEELRELGLM